VGFGFLSRTAMEPTHPLINCLKQRSYLSVCTIYSDNNSAFYSQSVLGVLMIIIIMSDYFLSCCDQVICVNGKCCEPGSSVSIMSDYGLDDRAIEVRSPAEVKGFFLSPLCPDRHWGPLSSLYRGSFPGAKSRPGRDADHSPPSSAEVENE
jgi:hypothetical protein